MDFKLPPEAKAHPSAFVYQLPAVLPPVDPFEGVIQVTMPLPRPGHFAEREELDAALASGKIEDLRLFLQRHPESRYRPEAEAALRKLDPLPSSPR